MSKWTTIASNRSDFCEEPMSKEEKVRKQHKFENAIRNVKTLSEKELKKEADALYDAEQAHKSSLIEAYNDNKLQSKSAIKEARAIKRKKNKKADSASEAAVV